MLVTLIALSWLVGVAYTIGGVAKLAGVGVMRKDAEHFGFSYRLYRLIGALELLGGIGVAAGLLLKPIGLAAAAGLALLMAGAVVAHVRAKDPVGKTAPAAVCGLLCIAIIALHSLALVD
ncbi:DoxX family protein [Saccharopolyspora pogona]|uniref:DoxX family protein n=1 Tax=Saccharopolyspora pogona TaxID=333966 RepID=UPI001CC255D7|nr:DoxX family protein [Saccharopolyspora pogona]